MRQAVDEAIDEMAAWPELAGSGKELKALRAYATFFVDAPLVMAVFGLPYVSRADEMLLARGLGARGARPAARRARTCRASAPPSSSCARRRTPWATARAG